jgi:hypothetical protein
MKKAWFCAAASLVLLAAPSVQATFQFNFENPGEGQEVSGITTISGWVFSTTGNPVSVQLFVDGAPTQTIPCCGSRLDVQKRVTGAPANTGFGLLQNYGLLSPGPHTIGVKFAASGEADQLVTHNVIVAKPGGRSGENAATFFSFLNNLDMGDARVAVDSDTDELIVAPVSVEDVSAPDGSGLTRQATLRLRWERSLQSFETVKAGSDGSFAAVQQIFTNRCAIPNCHVTGGPTPMALSAGQAFGNLVPIKSTEIPNLFRINPGDDKASYLYQKIIPNPTITIVGVRMPLGCSGSSCLSDSEIQTIEDWINNGAAPPQ